MRLNHLNLQVSDINVARESFERFFDLRCRYQREQEIAIFETGDALEFAVSHLRESLPPI